MQIIETSIMQAVKEYGQDESLGRVLYAWFKELASQNSDENDNFSDVERRIQILMEKTKVDSIEEE